MIDLMELETLMQHYLGTRERRFPFTLGPLNHQELARLQLDEFLDWLKVQQGEAPTWSSTLPTESGYYWARDPQMPENPPFIIWIETAPDGSFCWIDVFPEDAPLIETRLDRGDIEGWQWWPIPLSPPEVNT